MLTKILSFFGYVKASSITPLSYEQYKKEEDNRIKDNIQVHKDAVSSSTKDVNRLVAHIVKHAIVRGAIKEDLRKCDWPNSEQYVFRMKYNPKKFGYASTYAYWKVREQLKDYFPGWDVVLLLQNTWERYHSLTDNDIEIIFVKHRKSK